MNLSKSLSWKILLLAGGLAVFFAWPGLAAYAEESMEDVKVIERKPDASNPAYEIITVEGGLVFRAPKDMTFVKQYGVIAPVSTEEYCLRKFEGVGKRIDALNERVAALEAKMQKTADGKDRSQTN